MTTNIVGMGGSRRADSAGRHALRVALDGAEQRGARVQLLDLRHLDLPLYGAGGPTPPDARRLADAVATADGLIWASPLYHGTVSAAFKNALDWLQLLASDEPPYLTGKPVGLIATAGGTQGLQAINTMEYVVRALRGWTVPLVVPIPHSHGAFAPDGHALDADLAARLGALGAEVVDAAERFTRRPPAERIPA